MKKSTTVAVFILGLVFLIQTENSALSTDIEKSIEQASKVLLGASASQPEIVQALSQLLDCAAVLSESSQYADEIKNQLDIAKNEITKKSLFSDKGRQKLAFAYRMLTNGEKYQPPKELDDFVTPQQAAEKGMIYVKKLLEQTLDNINSGDQLQAAQGLVELVLMIVTPISGS
jgi:hypothetical protein